MSPHTTKNGNTTVAALLAFELSLRNRKVCLTHVKTKSNAFFSYFNINNEDDKTANPIQICNLIKEGGLRKNDISDYCKSLTENLELFSLNSNELEQNSFIDVIEFISTSFPHDYTVFDMDNNDLGSEECKTILKNCDCIIYILSQNSTEYESFKENKRIYKHWMNLIPHIVVVNQYNGIIGTLDDVACGIGLKKAKKWIKISDNPYLAWGTSHNKLLTIFKFMQNRDHRLVDVDSDIKNLVNSIMKVKQAKRAQKYEEYEKAKSNKPNTDNKSNNGVA